ALLGLLVAASAIASAPWLAGAVFKIASHDHDLAVRAIQLAGVGLVIRSIDSVFLATLRGYERYDLAAAVAMAVRIATIGGDVLLIGAILGSTQLAYYAVCVQLAQQVHALPAAAFSFLFPLVSGRSETSARSGLKALFGRYVAWNVLLAAALAAPLIFLGRPI